MGYYHINDTGKGVIIKDYKMPPIDYIKEYFESKRGIGKKNLEWLASMDVYHQLAYLALNDYRLSYIVSNLNEKTPEAFCKKYDESYSDDFSSDAANFFEGRLQVQVEQNLSSNYISGIHLIKKSVEQFIRSVVA